jgi:hypothetical protein
MQGEVILSTPPQEDGIRGLHQEARLMENCTQFNQKIPDPSGLGDDGVLEAWKKANT